MDRRMIAFGRPETDLLIDLDRAEDAKRALCECLGSMKYRCCALRSLTLHSAEWFEDENITSEDNSSTSPSSSSSWGIIVPLVQRVLAHSVRLQRLRLRRDGYARRSFDNVLVQLLPTISSSCETLDHLELDYATPSPSILERVFEISSIKSLTMVAAASQLTEAHVNALSRCVRRSPSVKEVWLETVLVGEDPISDWNPSTLVGGFAPLEKLHLDLCPEPEMQPPPSEYRTLLDSTTSSVNLQDLTVQINGRSLLSMFEALGANSSLKRLEISVGECNPSLARCLRSALQCNVNLEVLVMLVNGCLRDDWLGTPLSTYLANGLSLHPSLKQFSIDFCPEPPHSRRVTYSLETFDGFPWQIMLQNHKELTKLSLESFVIDSEAMACLGRGLAQNDSLAHLNLGCNRIHDEALGAFVHGVRGKNKRLESLVLRCNEIQDGSVVAQVLEGFSTLRELDMAQNRIEQNATMITNCLVHHPTLEELNLQGCAFSQLDVAHVFKILASNSEENKLADHSPHVQRSKNGPKLQVLRISLCDEEMGETPHREQFCTLLNALQECLQQNTSLNELHIEQLYAHQELQVIGQGLVHNTTLEAVIFDEPYGVDSEDISKFFALLPQMKGIRRVRGLEIGSKEGDANLVNVLADALRDNQVLYDVDWCGNRWLEMCNGDRQEEVWWYLQWNQRGRRFLLEGIIPSGLWPHVLAKLAKTESLTNKMDVVNASCLYHFLVAKPDLVTPNRKRKSTSQNLERNLPGPLRLALLQQTLDKGRQLLRSVNIETG